MPQAPLAALLLTDIDSATQAILNEALELCSPGLDSGNSQAVLERLRENEALVARDFMLGLGKQISEYLAGCDSSVRAIYAYAPDPVTDARSAWRLHLIVWAEPKTAALNSLVAALDRALVRRLGELIGNHLLNSFLDVQVLDDLDINGGSGYAALFLLPHYRPVQIWKRETHGVPPSEGGLAAPRLA